MIQRIQTLYLIVVTILLVFIIFFPIADFIRSTDEMIFSLSVSGLVSDSGEIVEHFSVYPLFVLLGVSILITLSTIFLYKKRMLQIRFCIFNIIVLLGFQGLMFYYVRFAQTYLPGTASYNLFFVFPVVSAILVFLALRAIARDEALVRSLDRLR